MNSNRSGSSTSHHPPSSRLTNYTTSPAVKNHKAPTYSTKLKSKPNIRDKLGSLESNLQSLKKDMTLKENYHQDQLYKTQERTVKDFEQQVKSLKEAMNKLTDVIVEEFEQVRTEN